MSPTILRIWSTLRCHGQLVPEIFDHEHCKNSKITVVKLQKVKILIMAKIEIFCCQAIVVGNGQNFNPEF